ncbi:Pheophytinase [Actinidia chinensis var. chinensis]|uniref:Pheophytinase n=1 Tax=Actinidia chinensis var. chinensis TaxID=1590841 RepID=A0A2R6QTQ5_ACTCC|nr:Pheophytinase [Actinidia chinensis var. chinensis]
MASTSSSMFALSKVEFPAVYPHRTRKKPSRPIPFGPSNPSTNFLLPRIIPRLSLSNSDGYGIRSRLDANVVEDPTKDKSPSLEVKTRVWSWRGYSIRYQYSGNSGPALVLVHGFGANSGHWRKNIPVLACSHRVFSIDLIGYGYSDKPNPRDFGVNSFYTFETWATQLNEFCVDVVKDKAFFICNSIGGVVGLQAAVMEPEICRGIVILNISLRMLHIKKQPWYVRPLIRSLQSLLRNTALGKFFYRSVATPESVKSILCQCYHDTSQVTDDLVETILLPGLEPGAVDVFLEFVCYSGGPLPEELLPQVKCPVLVAWGDKDPWEPIELGRAYEKFDSVEDFIVLPNVGHCPQDEAPHLVNPLVESFVARHVTSQASLSAEVM